MVVQQCQRVLIKIPDKCFIIRMVIRGISMMETGPVFTCQDQPGPVADGFFIDLSMLEQGSDQPDGRVAIETVRCKRFL